MDQKLVPESICSKINVIIVIRGEGCADIRPFYIVLGGDEMGNLRWTAVCVLLVLLGMPNMAAAGQLFPPDNAKTDKSCPAGQVLTWKNEAVVCTAAGGGNFYIMQYPYASGGGNRAKKEIPNGRCTMNNPATGSCSCLAGQNSASSMSGQGYWYHPWDVYWVITQCY